MSERDELSSDLQSWRDLAAEGASASRMPSAGQLRRRGEQLRRRRQAMIATGSLALVVAVTGGVFAGTEAIRAAPSGVPAGPSAGTPSSVPATSSPATPSPDPAASAGPVTNPPGVRLSGQIQNVWVWAPPAADGRRLLSVNATGGLDLKRSSTKQSTGSLFHHELTLVPAGTTSENKDPGQYQIMSPEDSEEINAYCVSAGGASGFELKVCRKSAVEQRFTLARVKGGYTIFSQYWSGWLIAAGRTVDWSADQAATVFTLQDVPQN